MTTLVIKRMKHNVAIYPRTWRWLRWHSAYLVVTGTAAVLVHIGFFT